MIQFDPMMLVAAALVGTALYVAQPLVLKASCAMVGEASPRYGTGLLALITASVVGSIAGGLYTLTLGGFLAALSPVLAGAGALVISALVISVVYSAFLRIGIVTAAKVAIVHHVLGLGLSAITWFAFQAVFGP